jgi:hypothetical protein
MDSVSVNPDIFIPLIIMEGIVDVVYYTSKKEK